MTMTVDQYRANLAFLKEHSLQYPYSCRTKNKWPRPDEVQRLTQLDFVSAPLMKECEWRFRTAEDMRKFKQNYTTLDNAS